MSAHHTAIVQVTIEGRLHGQQTINVLNFGATGLEPNYAQLLLDIVDCIVTALRPAVTDQWSLVKLTARQLWPVLSDPIEHTPATTIAGAGLPGGVSFSAYLFQIRTGLGGRTNRGRFFIAGTIENDVDNSRTTDSAHTKLLAFATCMLGKFIGGATPTKAFELGVLSRKEASAVGATLQTAFTECKNIIPQREVAVMRSRRIGHGN